MATEDLTRRQAALISELRRVESDLGSLQRRRANIKAELERIYPQARALVEPPKDQGVVLSVHNYDREGYDCQITITAKGKRALHNFDPVLTPLDFNILALLAPREAGANATKLLAVPLIKEDGDGKRRISYLHKWAYVDLDFTGKVVQA